MAKNCKDCNDVMCGGQGSDNISATCKGGEYYPVNAQKAKECTEEHSPISKGKDYVQCKYLDAGPEGMNCRAGDSAFSECAIFLNQTKGHVVRIPPRKCPYSGIPTDIPVAPSMKEYETGAVREDRRGKGRCDLLPPCVMLRMARYYENSITSAHPAHNWEKGMPTHELVDSSLRHTFKYEDGMTEEDHLAAAIWNLMGCMYMEEKHPEMQDIPARLETRKC